MIELEDVQFRWHPSGPVVLDIARLSVEAGERIFLQGPSGSGKTTLLNLLGGIVLPQRGRIGILDQELAAMSAGERDHFRAGYMGIIFQVFNLVPYLSLVDNVSLPCLFSHRRRERARSRAGSVRQAAEDLLAALGIPPSQFSGAMASELSTGQQQRVAVARALIGDPEIIITDEPTSALDQENAETFLNLLFRELAARKATLLFVSHDQRLASRFDSRLTMAELQRKPVSAP